MRVDGHSNGDGRSVARAISIRQLLRLPLFAALLLALAPLAQLVPASPASAAETILMPFRGGQAVRIIQGYNGGTHQGRSGYGLDLVLTGGGTSGAEVLAPIDGRVNWAYAPGTGNGCMSISMNDRSFSVVLCHVIFLRTFRQGEAISRGQPLGSVGGPGTVGNNGTPHVHMELHRGTAPRGPVAFSPPDGLPLEGVSLPSSGARSEHAFREPIVSSNGPGSGQPASEKQEVRASPTASVPAGSGAPEPPRQPEAPPVAEPVAETATASAQAPEVAAAATPPVRAAETSEPPAIVAQQQTEQAPLVAATAALPPARAAVVHGTEVCLNVRQEPSVTAPVVDCLPDGTEVPLSGAEERGEAFAWLEIEDLGWMVGDYLRRTRAVVSGTEACLNVREEPSTEALVLTCLDDGTSVEIVEGPLGSGGEDWYRIGSVPGLEPGGWVVGLFLD